MSSIRKPLTQKQYLELWVKQGGKCALTGEKFPTGYRPEDDHIVPVSLADKDGQIYDDKLDKYISVNDISNRRLVMKTAHKIKTKTDTKIAAKSKRIQAKNAGFKKETGFTNRKWKKKVDGTVVNRETGEPV